MKSKYPSMSLFLLLIMLQLMRREHKHRDRDFNWGIAKTGSMNGLLKHFCKVVSMTQLSFPGLVRCQEGGRLDCRTETLNTCIKLADPLLEDPRYVFPAANEDVDHVCK